MTSISLDKRYTINSPDVVSEDFNGQVVILNLGDGRYFSLSGIASTVWSTLLAGHTPQVIFESIAQQRPNLSEEVGNFIERLAALHLIRLGDGVPADILEAIAIRWAEEPPRIEVFDDLAELIFVDPIHDVDEQVGWPAPRPESSNRNDGPTG